MTGTQMRNETTADAPARGVDMKLEIVVIPVSDVDRAKRFYGGLGWRLDADFAAGDDLRIIQFTPPGSGCSIIFGRNVTAAAPGSAQGLYLIVPDIKAVREDLVRRGVQISDIFHGSGEAYAGPDEPFPVWAASGRRCGSRARQLPVVRLVQGSGRQWLAVPGGHRTIARARRRRRHDLHLVGRTCDRASPRGGRAWRA